MYFDDTPEEYDFYYKLMKDLEKIAKKDGMRYITCDFKNAEDFYNALNAMSKYADENISLYGTSREGLYEMIIQDETDMDDLEKEKEKARKSKEEEKAKKEKKK